MSAITYTARTAAANWSNLASSGDGANLVAYKSTGTSGYLYTSADSGISWVQRLVNDQIASIASSYDGGKLVAIEAYGHILTSDDYGITWINRASIQTWIAVASSDDGVYLVAITESDIYVSTDSGVTWVMRHSAGQPLADCAMSNDGSKIIVTAAYTFILKEIYRSSNYGITWITSNAPKPLKKIACSADGITVVGLYKNGNGMLEIYMSANFCASWTLVYTLSFSDANLDCLVSADGLKVLIVMSTTTYPTYSGVILTSENSCVTWAVDYVHNNLWLSCAMSADGTKVVIAGSDSPICTGVWLSPIVINESISFCAAADFSLVTQNIIHDSISFGAVADFNLSAKCAYHETVSFAAVAADFSLSVTCAYHEYINFGAVANTSFNLIEPTYLGVAYSTENKSITCFNNLPFDGSCVFNGKTLFFNEHGLFEYGGVDDDGVPIVASIKTDKSNRMPGQGGMYHSQHRKRLTTNKVYVSCEAQSVDLTVTVDDESYPYMDDVPKSGLAVRPIPVGAGLDGVAWQFEISGCEKIESIEYELTEIRRRGK